jgi:hypothetical protein
MPGHALTLTRRQHLENYSPNTACSASRGTAAAAATPTTSAVKEAQAKAQTAIAIEANMRATGHSAEEISAALVQLFLNCPPARPDEAGEDVDVDESRERTESESK